MANGTGRARPSSCAERSRAAGVITPEFVTACVRRLTDERTILLNEGITNYPAICNHMARTLPGTYFNSGGGSLGWNGGAAIGAKLASPDSLVVALTGDGSYMFSQPSTVHWMARHYKTPFLQVVYNNRGWKAPKFSALAVHPDGYASRANEIDVSFDPPPDYAAIAAAAGGAFAKSIRRPDEVEAGIAEGLEGRARGEALRRARCVARTAVRSFHLRSDAPPSWCRSEERQNAIMLFFTTPAQIGDVEVIWS